MGSKHSHKRTTEIKAIDAAAMPAGKACSFQLQPGQLSAQESVVQDAKGWPLLQLKGKLFGGKRSVMVLEMSGKPLLQVSKQSFGGNSVHFFSDPHSKEVLATTSRWIDATRPKIRVYSGEGCERPRALAYTIRGDFDVYMWDVRNSEGEIVASSRPAEGGNYAVDVMPGTDAVLVLGMVLAIEKVHVKARGRVAAIPLAKPASASSSAISPMTAHVQVAQVVQSDCSR